MQKVCATSSSTRTNIMGSQPYLRMVLFSYGIQGDQIDARSNLLPILDPFLPAIGTQIVLTIMQFYI